MSSSVPRLAAIATLLLPSLVAAAATESRCVPAKPTAVQPGGALAQSETAGGNQMTELQVMMLLHQLDGRRLTLIPAMPAPAPTCCEALRASD